jgi:hypothetical protein
MDIAPADDVEAGINRFPHPVAGKTVPFLRCVLRRSRRWGNRPRSSGFAEYTRAHAFIYFTLDILRLASKNPCEQYRGKIRTATGGPPYRILGARGKAGYLIHDKIDDVFRTIRPSDFIEIPSPSFGTAGGIHGKRQIIEKNG